MRLCGYAAEMLRDEFVRQKPEQKRLQLQWHMLYPEDYGSKEEKLSSMFGFENGATRCRTAVEQTYSDLQC